MICASCRTVNLDGMVFCAKCGRGLISSSGDDTANIPFLTWQIADGTPQTYLLTKALTTIGRVGGNDIILPESGVSRQHARIERSGTRCILTDLGSLNGTFVNNERIDTERDLVDADVVRIGHVSIQIRIPANVASINRAPTTGHRLLDADTAEHTALDRSVLAAIPVDEGPATLYEMPTNADEAALAESPTQPQAEDLDAERTVMGEDVTAAELAATVAATPVVAEPIGPSEATFWLVTGDGTRVPVRDVVSIGRGEDNTIVLSQDRQVSRRHARISPEGDRLILEDLGSANGSFLNEERVTNTADLKVGDEVRIGGTRLRVQHGTVRQVTGPSGEEKTLYVEDDQDTSEKTISGAELQAELAAMGPPPSAQQVLGEASVEVGDQPRLTITWGPQSGQTFALDKEVVVIGRGGVGTSEYDVVLQDRAVSRPHAKLVRTGDLFLLHDLESANGTFLNYEQVTTPRVLQDGDLIKLGKTVMLYRTPVAAPAPPEPAYPTVRPSGHGQVITFFSLKGGVGTTALAVNTALLMRELTQEPVVLVDLSVERGTVTAHLTVDLRRHLDDLASLPTVDPEVVQGIVAHHASGLDVLPAPQSPQTAELVTAELMSAVFPVLKASYRWIILDTTATFSELNLAAFDQSDLVVVVTAPDLATLKTTQNCLDVFSALQTTGERRLLLLNQVYARPRLEPADIAKALGERIDLVVPFGEEVLHSIDRGVPLAIGQRDHPVVRALDGFVRKVAAIQEPAATTRAAKGGFWLKLKGLMGR